MPLQRTNSTQRNEFIVDFSHRVSGVFVLNAFDK